MAEELQIEPQVLNAIRETVREAVPAPIREALRVELAEADNRRMDGVVKENITAAVARYSHLVEGRIQMLGTQYQAEIDAMASESKARVEERRRTLRWTLLKPVVEGLAVVAVLAVAGWGLHQWTALRLRTAVGALSEIEDRIAGARLRLGRIEERTWGVALIENEGRCLVLLPEVADVETHLRFDGRRAAELPCPVGASND